MERSRLKTIIILILALVNLALALSLGLGLHQGRTAEAALLSELRERFTAEGCALPQDIPTDTPPMVVTMERDSSREGEMAEAILGEGTEYIDQGGGIAVYRSGSGQATFRAGGSFSVTLRLPDGESTPTEQAEQRVRAFARAAGFETPTLLSGSGSAAQRYQQRPQLIHRQYRAQSQKDQRHCIKRQNAGLLSADDLTHEPSPSLGKLPLMLPMIPHPAKNARVSRIIYNLAIIC